MPLQISILSAFPKRKKRLNGRMCTGLSLPWFCSSKCKDQYYSDNKWIDSTERFEKQMKYLNDNGWTTLTLDEFYDWQQNGKEIPKKSCLITFDDGYYEMYYQILPILKKYHFNGASFVVGSYTPDTTPAYDPAQRHMIGWDKIHEVESSLSLAFSLRVIPIICMDLIKTVTSRGKQHPCQNCLKDFCIKRCLWISVYGVSLWRF